MIARMGTFSGQKGESTSSFACRRFGRNLTPRNDWEPQRLGGEVGELLRGGGEGDVVRWGFHRLIIILANTKVRRFRGPEGEESL